MPASYPGAPRHLDIDRREEDREAPATLEHQVEHRVPRVVVVVAVAEEAVAATEEVPERLLLILGARAGHRGEFGGEAVELVERPGGVNLPEFPGKGKRQLVERGVGACG